MRTPGLKKHISRVLEPSRVFITLLVCVVLYFLPLGEKPEFIEYNGGIIEVSQTAPILKTFYPEASYATCGAGGTGTNCHTGCCRAGACVVCPPQPDDQPPTINGSLNCSQAGDNGWCIGSLSLDLSASDPQGHAVLISGSINGAAFACASGDTSCSIPITDEGTGTITYRVDAASGLSDSDSANYQLDKSTPALDGSLIYLNKNNDWYRSNVTLEVTSSDDVSGLASTTVDVDGSGPSAYTSPITFTDGIYNVTLIAADNAGNVTQTTQTIQVDTVTPTLSTSLSGASGLNGWYISNVTITPSASDATSGLASLEVNADNGGYIHYTTPIVFTDGVHTIQFRAIDAAGNETETSQQTIQVDTTTPSINLSISGTTGTNGWYVSNVTVTANVSDATSTVGLVEAKRNNDAWIAANQLSFADGIHTYQFRVTDHAGNVTVIPIQNLKVDTIAPAVDMTAELDLGDTLYYELQDDGSGLYFYRAVIEDEDERYKKVVWLDVLNGNYHEGSIRWDGKFADGTQAGFGGVYMITLKISDAAGNETMKTAFVDVGLFSFLQDIPTFTPPPSSPLPDTTTQTESSSQTFGGENNNTQADEESTTINAGGATMNWGDGDYITAGFNIPSETIAPLNANSTSGTNPLTPTNILFGAAATAIVGMTLAEWERQREEERKRQEQEQAKEDRMNIKAKRQQQKDAEAAVRERWAQEEYLQNYAEHIERKMERIDAVEDAKWTTTVSAIQKRKEEEARQDRMNERIEEKMAQVDEESDAEWTSVQEAEKERLMAVDAARWAGIAAMEQAKEDAEKNKSWWEKTKEWYQENVEGFVRQPPPFMSVSYQAPFDPKNLFIDEMIYPQFSARNGFQTWVYQSASVSINTTSKITSNPSGWVDLNFSNGRITIKGKPLPDGSRLDYFIQPFALSVGQISLTPTKNPKVKTVNVSTFDFDVLGVKDWMSLKVSQSTGISTTIIETLPTGETIAISNGMQLQATVNIHRWPRILVVAGAFIFVWEAAGVATMLEALATAPVVQQAIQAIP